MHIGMDHVEHLVPTVAEIATEFARQAEYHTESIDEALRAALESLLASIDVEPVIDQRFEAEYDYSLSSALAEHWAAAHGETGLVYFCCDACDVSAEEACGRCSAAMVEAAREDVSMLRHDEEDTLRAEAHALIADAAYARAGIAAEVTQ